MSRITYLVHNLGDSAVLRRIRMLAAGGAEITLAGFCRDNETAANSGSGISLGVTHDAALLKRARSVASNLMRPATVLAACRGADVIVARNLETLVLGVMAKRRLGIPRLVYECLDIHRTLLGNRLHHRLMRAVERILVRSVDLVLYSSPAFSRAYFLPVQHFSTSMLLVENKLLTLDDLPIPAAAPSAPPWRIAWFGNLRCRRTLAILTELTASSAGRIEVLIAGKPSPAEFPDFNDAVARPGLTYHGPYRAEDLPALYGQCHFAWAIDFFEEGLNSSWLLPNRLYEASAYGCVPIALKDVETGRWLEAWNAGILFDSDVTPDAVATVLTDMQGATFAAMRCNVKAITPNALLTTREDCDALIAALLG